MTHFARSSVRNCTEKFSRAWEPARGLGASRRPFGDVRLAVTHAQHCTMPNGQTFSQFLTTTKTTTKHQPTKVSTLDQDLTTHNRPMHSAYNFVCQEDQSHLQVPVSQKLHRHRNLRFLFCNLQIHWSMPASNFPVQHTVSRIG